MKKPHKIVHITTVHPRGDTRIAVKEVASLRAVIDAPVILYVQDGLGDELDAQGNHVVVDTGPRPMSRFKRMTLGSWRMFRAVRKARATIVHFHDPELIFIGLILKVFGVRVIYDIHENLPKQIQNKNYIPRELRYVLGRMVAFLEAVAFRIFDGAVSAATSIEERIPAHKSILLRNYPITEEIILKEPTPYHQRKQVFTYAGGLTKIRGAREMIMAIELTQHKGAILNLAGSFQAAQLERELNDLADPERVTFHGFVGRREIATLLDQTRAGLAVLHPTLTHIDGLPVKFFEYMAAGLPIIASDFPVWRNMIEEVGCGLLVDPLDPQMIAQAIDHILDHPQEAAEMGQRGLRAVQDTYNWHTEVQTLIQFYHQKLGVPLATKPQRYKY